MFVGTHEIARQNFELRAAWEQIGAHAVSAIRAQNQFYPECTYDLTIGRPVTIPQILEVGGALARIPRGIWRRGAPAAQRVEVLRLMTDFDVYVFLWGFSLMDENRDLPILRALGKKIVCVFLGSDIRHWSAAEPARQIAGMDAYTAYRDAVPLAAKLRTLRMAEMYADVVMAQPSYAELALRPYHHLYLAIDTSRLECAVPNREVPRVVHAPSRAELKGTSEILEVLNKLRAEGVRFDLRLLQDRPNSEVLEELREADVLIDELRETNYGMIALEAMASGCAVAGGNAPGIVPLPAERPIHPISPETVQPQLRRLLTDRALRLELANAGRPYVEAHHSPIAVAAGMDRAIAGAAPDYRPGFFAKRYAPPGGEEIPKRLRRMSWKVIRRWGLPEGVDPRDLERRGLVSIPGRDRARVPSFTPGPALVDRI